MSIKFHENIVWYIRDWFPSYKPEDKVVKTKSSVNLLYNIKFVVPISLQHSTNQQNSQIKDTPTFCTPKLRVLSSQANCIPISTDINLSFEFFFLWHIYIVPNISFPHSPHFPPSVCKEKGLFRLSIHTGGEVIIQGHKFKKSTICYKLWFFLGGLTWKVEWSQSCSQISRRKRKHREAQK